MASISASTGTVSSADNSATDAHRPDAHKDKQLLVWLNNLEADLLAAKVNMEYVFVTVDRLLAWYAQYSETVYMHPCGAVDALESVIFNTIVHKLYLQFCKLLLSIPDTDHHDSVSRMTSFYRTVCLDTPFLPSLTQVKCIQEHVHTDDLLVFEANEECAGIKYLIHVLTQLGIRTMCINRPDGSGATMLSPADVDPLSIKNVLESKKHLIGSDKIVLGVFPTRNDPAESALCYFHSRGGARVLLLGTSAGDLWTVERHYLRNHFALAQTVNNICLSACDGALPNNIIKKVPAPLQVYKAHSRLMSATWLPEHSPLTYHQMSYPLEFESCESTYLKFLTLVASSSIDVPAGKSCSAVEWVSGGETTTTTPPCWLPVLTTPLLHSGTFTVALHVDSMQDKQIGVGFYLAQALPHRVDFGFFGYLGSSNTSWSYDPTSGDIVTATRSIRGNLPTFKNKSSGTIRMHFTLAREQRGSMQFEIDGQLIAHSIELPFGAVVVPACCLLGIYQRVTITECIRTIPKSYVEEPPKPVGRKVNDVVGEATATADATVTNTEENNVPDAIAFTHRAKDTSGASFPTTRYTCPDVEISAANTEAHKSARVELPKVNAVYRHYRNGEKSKILALAMQTGTDDEALTVVYQGLYECANNLSNVWCRRLDQWCETVEDKVTGTIVPRFSLVSTSVEDDSEEHF
jgi:hypothetical protein